MKTKILLLITFLVALSSCSKESTITELVLTVSKTRVLDNKTDEIIASVVDQDGNNVSSEVELVFNDLVLSSNSITSENPGTYILFAEYNEIKSNNIQLEVVEDSGYEYKKIVLVEQYTATWCPWCPRSIAQIDDLRALNNSVVHIAYHLNDQMSYNLNGSLYEHFDFEGIPAVIADRTLDWFGNASDIESLQNPVRAGIDIVVGAISSDAFSVEVSVRFGILFAEDINLSVYLVEDNLIADQKSHYNDDSNSPWYQRGETISDLEHKNVMLATVTNLFGDQIPNGNIDIGSIYQKTFQVEAPASVGSGTPWITDSDQAKIVAFLSYGSGPMKGDIINSIECNIGSDAGNELLGAN